MRLPRISQLVRRPAQRPTGRASQLLARRPRWRQAAEWLHEQDRRRVAEQRRFAAERVRLQLEEIYLLPSYTTARSKRAIPGTDRPH
jgi:hypothetical protein